MSTSPPTSLRYVALSTAAKSAGSESLISLSTAKTDVAALEACAQSMTDTNEHCYVSPVRIDNASSGAVLNMNNIALMNHAALGQLPDLQSALVALSQTQPGGCAMDGYQAEMLRCLRHQFDWPKSVVKACDEVMALLHQMGSLPRAGRWWRDSSGYCSRSW